MPRGGAGEHATPKALTLAITLNPNPNPNPNQASTQEDEESGNDALDEGYLTRGGAQEASWPAPQQAQHALARTLGVTPTLT